MRLVGREMVVEFMAQHADVRDPLKAWVKEVEDADWATPQQLKARHASASFLANDEVVFNVKGNAYRLKVKVNYPLRIVLVLRVGTHAEYSRW